MEPSPGLTIVFDPTDLRSSPSTRLWSGQIGSVPAAPSFSLVGQVPEPVSIAREEAARVVARLVASERWTVRGLNVARLLRDLLVREIGEHLLALLRAEAICDALGPVSVGTPSPLRPGYYAGDHMVAESLRFVAQRREIEFGLLGSPARALRSSAADFGRRAGLDRVAIRSLRQALSAPRARGAPPSRSPVTCHPSPAVLAVGPCFAAELDAHRPITDALRERGWRIAPFEIPFYYTRRDWRGDMLPEPTVPLGAWRTRETVATANAASEELLDGLHERTPEHHDVFSALGYALLESSYFVARLARLLTVEARVAVALHGCARHMCESVRPSVLLTSKGEGPQIRAAMLAALEVGIPVAFTPHGVVSDDPRWDDVPADLVLANSEPFAETVARRAGTRPRVAAIGTPKYDAFLRSHATGSPAEARTAVLASAVRPLSPHDGGPGGDAASSPWLAVAATDRTDCDLANTAAVAAFARSSSPPPVVVVKTHPRRSQPETVQAFSEAAGPSGVVVTSGVTMEILSCCDVVVTGASTAAIEAMATGRPVIYVGSLDDDVYGYAREGAASHAPAPEAIPALLTQLLGGEGALQALGGRGLEFAARSLGPLDGHATERAVGEVERLLTERGTG
jgi:hypothetical protein